MDTKYQKLIKSLCNKEYLHFNEQSKEVAHSIIEHNKKCEINNSINNREFWDSIINGNYTDFGVLELVIKSPFAPKEIKEQAIQETLISSTLIEALKQEEKFSAKTYNHILKHSKKQILSILKKCYNNVFPTPLPFSQHAIEYYGNKLFKKSFEKNDEMFAFLAYVKDKKLLTDFFKSPLLDGYKLNYLANNIYITDDERNALFSGEICNFVPFDYNNMKIGTSFIVNELYRVNSDGYLMCDKTDKTTRNNIAKNIMNLIISSLTTEGIEKDIINKFPQNDGIYENIMEVLLQNTQYIDVLQYAFDKTKVSLFSRAFENLNITDSFLQEYGLLYVEKLLSDKMCKKRLKFNMQNIDIIIKKTTLKQTQYEDLLSTQNSDIINLICISPYTPDDILKKILSSKENVINDRMRLICELNLKMRESEFSNDDIYTWCYKILNDKIGYKLTNCSEYDKKYIYGDDDIDIFQGVDEDTIKMVENFDDKFNPIMNELYQKYRLDATIDNYFEARSAYNIMKGIEEDNSSSLGYYLNMRHELCVMFNRQEEILDKFNDNPTLGHFYSIVDEYVDEWNDIEKKIGRFKEISK
jgi:hypothetical protein